MANRKPRLRSVPPTATKKPRTVLRPAQITLTITFADIESGEVGDITQPVQVHITGKQWRADWQTPKSVEVFRNLAKQLSEQQT